MQGKAGQGKARQNIRQRSGEAIQAKQNQTPWYAPLAGELFQQSKAKQSKTIQKTHSVSVGVGASVTFGVNVSGGVSVGNG